MTNDLNVSLIKDLQLIQFENRLSFFNINNALSNLKC